MNSEKSLVFSQEIKETIKRTLSIEDVRDMDICHPLNIKNTSPKGTKEPRN